MEKSFGVGFELDHQLLELVRGGLLRVRLRNDPEGVGDVAPVPEGDVILVLVHSPVPETLVVAVGALGVGVSLVVSGPPGASRDPMAALEFRECLHLSAGAARAPADTVHPWLRVTGADEYGEGGIRPGPGPLLLAPQLLQRRPGLVRLDLLLAAHPQKRLAGPRLDPPKGAALGRPLGEEADDQCAELLVQGNSGRPDHDRAHSRRTTSTTTNGRDRRTAVRKDFRRSSRSSWRMSWR